MSLEVATIKDEEFTSAPGVHPETSEDSASSSISPSKVDGQNDGGRNVFNDISITPSVVENSNRDTQKLVPQSLVAIDENSIINFTPDNNVNNLQVITNNCNGNNGTIYLLVSSNDSSPPVLHPIQQSQQQQEVPSTISQTVNIANTTDSLKHPTQDLPTADGGEIVQFMNTNGVPVNLNINELFASIHSSNKNSNIKKESILNLSTSIISTTGNSSENAGTLPIQNKDNVPTSGQYINPSTTNEQIDSMPNWAMHLRDCVLCGDTYAGYVTTESEMDVVLNLYKKETQSLFAIRQTPSPAKDESADTVRLMWKSQYVPYDGIPFVNVGRRATVMECEHGPRKRSNALKRMAHMQNQKHKSKRIPNLTCPARLFVKKVRKFPQYRVPLEADPAVIRSMQNHALKMVRSNGIHSGEIRLYMQLPLPSAHRYHHIGNPVEAFRKNNDCLDDHVWVQSISVDDRVMNQLQVYVRQGYKNPFQVRAALKNFVDSKMELGLHESKPQKHDKAFFPTLIEIQNMIQQTEAAVDAGYLEKLPTPDVPPVQIRQKRKRTSTVESPVMSSPSSPSPSSLIIKRTKIDIPIQDIDGIQNSLNEECKRSETDSSTTNTDQSETIALTLTDSQLENFSVTDFSYDQLAQLAKIGLIALNNAAKDGEGTSSEEQSSTSSLKTKIDENTVVEPVSFSTSDGESILIVTPNNAEEEKARLRILTGDVPNNPEPLLTNTVIEGK